MRALAACSDMMLVFFRPLTSQHSVVVFPYLLVKHVVSVLQITVMF